jgi:hypothetical protein
MRLVWLAAAGISLAGGALAQRPPIQEQALPPLPLSPAQPPAAAPDVPPAAASASPPPAPAWVKAGVAKLQVLDKVNAQASTLTVKVGQSATFGSLTIDVKSCVVRPPDQPADAAAYVDVTDSHPDSPGFNGWLLANEPSVSMMQHPIYDLRLAGCA